MLCRVVTVKRLPVHHYNADEIFWSFRITDFILSYFDIGVPLKPILGRMTGVADFLSDNE